jgi:hypothetical protein
MNIAFDNSSTKYNPFGVSQIAHLFLLPIIVEIYLLPKTVSAVPNSIGTPSEGAICTLLLYIN